MNTIMLYGGTFDPPHLGHLHTARAIQQHIHPDRFVFIPCKTPLLKAEAATTSAQRMSMLKLALQEDPYFEIDDREITRDTPSYMIETLQSYRLELVELDQGQAPAAIILCLGMDAFLQLPQWHDWKNILNHCHLLVMWRENQPPLTEPLLSLLVTHETTDKQALQKLPYGKIYRFHAGDYPISSRWIREQLRVGGDIEAYVPASVYRYIKDQKIY